MSGTGKEAKFTRQTSSIIKLVLGKLRACTDAISGSDSTPQIGIKLASVAPLSTNPPPLKIVAIVLQQPINQIPYFGFFFQKGW